MTGTGFAVRTIELDLPALAAALNRRLHEAGVPTTAERAARFAQALDLVRPVSRRRLYWTARAVFVSDQAQLGTFDSVFRSVFGGPWAAGFEPEDAEAVAGTDGEPREQMDGDRIKPGPIKSTAATERAAPSERPQGDDREPEHELPVPMSPSDEEVLRGKRFDALEPAELALLYRLMARLRVATPSRRTRRARRDRRGEQLDMRRTLRGSLRTAGDPIRLARRRRRVVPRRMVMLCDISGSMEPYARAYLQFLTSAAGSGPNVEAFAFATRLTRLTRALRSRNPERAIQRAAAAAPDWSSGTRIGDALRSFNDRHGRRGMARGAILVILSDGWERGDPALVGREMERLSRLAHRIVWVNPRVAASDFSPRAGGMAAALPWCDAVLSGHSLEALEEVAEAIAADSACGDRLGKGAYGDRLGKGAFGDRINPVPISEEEQEDWPSATPVQGSSVAMPSGYGPSRGRTTPGWGPDGRE